VEQKNAARLQGVTPPLKLLLLFLGKGMNVIELAWAAGFYDGEGSSIYRYSDSRRQRCLQITIQQNHREVLDRFKSAVGVGRVNGPYPYNRGRSGEYYSYQVSNAAGFRKVVRALWPFLGTEKKRQFIKAMRGFVHDGIKLRTTRRQGGYGPIPMKLVS
jgi:hypothetical protein